LSDFGTTTQVREANADPGVGVYEDVVQRERFAEGYKGEYFRMGEPAIHPAAQKATDGNDPYDVTTLVWEDTHTVGFTGETSTHMLTIFTPDTSHTMSSNSYMENATEGVWAVLNALLSNFTVSAV